MTILDTISLHGLGCIQVWQLTVLDEALLLPFFHILFLYTTFLSILICSDFRNKTKFEKFSNHPIGDKPPIFEILSPFQLLNYVTYLTWNHPFPNLATLIQYGQPHKERFTQLIRMYLVYVYTILTNGIFQDTILFPVQRLKRNKHFPRYKHHYTDPKCANAQRNLRGYARKMQSNFIWPYKYITS